MGIQKQTSGTVRCDTGTDDAAHFKTREDPELTYEQYMEGTTDDQFALFSVNATYAKGALIRHSKFGKGVVVGVEGLRVVVLFADGPKKLSHMSPV